MDALLASAARYSAGLAIRSGISIAGGFAIRQVSTYISKVPQNLYKDELELVSKRLDQKIKLTVSLRNDINAFGQRMSEAVDANPNTSQGSRDATKKIIDDMKTLLARIEDAVPLISLALTTSGANLSASLPSTVSPSRLLQASSHLQNADISFDRDTSCEVQVGPSFSLKLYTIFEGHSRNSKDLNVSNITWQETYARSILEVIRMPMQADLGHDARDQRDHKIDYLYHFRVTENLVDGRYHEELVPGKLKKDAQGFIRGASRDIPVHNIARLFFSASGRLLNIEEARTPVLVLKINHALRGPSAVVRAIFAGDSVEQRQDQDVYGRKDVSGEQEGETQDLGSPDDLEWVALELWTEDEESDSDMETFDTASENSSSEAEEEKEDRADTEATIAPESAPPSDSSIDELAMRMQVLEMSKGTSVPMKTGHASSELASLSLLEYILRLSALQTSEQQSVLAISDERISLFLRDDSGQSRARSHQEAEAVRRKSHERFDTPASSIFYDEFIPGTQVKPSRSKKSKHGTPSSVSSTPISSHQKRRAGSSITNPNMSDTPQSATMSTTLGVPGTLGSRRWQHTKTTGVDPSSSITSVQSESPLVKKSDKLSRSSNLRTKTDNKKEQNEKANLFQTSNDLRSKTNNGFSSRLRHSVKEPEVESHPTEDEGLPFAPDDFRPDHSDQ